MSIREAQRHSMTTTTTENPLLTPGRGRSRRRLSRRITRAHFRPLSRPRLKRRGPRSKPSRQTRAADLRQHGRGAGAHRPQPRQRSRVFFNLAGAAAMTSLRRSSARSRRSLVSPSQRDLSQRGAFRSHRGPAGRPRRSLASTTNRPACSNAIISTSSRTGAGLAGGHQGAARRHRRTPGDARGAVRTERAGRREGFLLVLEAPSDLAGLPDWLVAAAARDGGRARASRASMRSRCRAPAIEPFLQFSARRDLREKAFRAWAARGENGGAHDNRADRGRDREAARGARAPARL